MPLQTRTFFVAVEPAIAKAVEDILYRFASGQDLKDRALFESAFALDAELDFTQPAAKLRIELQAFRGRTGIADQIMAATAALDTTHTVTNTRFASFEGEKASITALVEAQHLPHTDHSRHLLLKNIYFVDAVRAGTAWVAERMTIRNVWSHGDTSVLFPTA